MANRAVSIWYGVRVSGQFKRLKPVYGKNNKIRPGWAVLNEKPTELPGGSYYIGWYEGPRRFWKNAGLSPQDAVDMAVRQRLYLRATRVGVPVQKAQGVSPTLSTAIHIYLEDYRLSRDAESHKRVKHALAEFQRSCRRTHLKDITRMDLLRFADWLQRPKDKKKGNSPRTANKKFMRVHQFLKAYGIELVTMTDAPGFVEQRAEVYSAEELNKFFAKRFAARKPN
jgi:Phage integrase SAM-like domain